MTNEQIILNEAAKLDPATLHAIATAHHTPEQIAAIAAKATTTDDDGNEKPASVADVEAVLAADELHTIAKWNSLNKRIPHRGKEPHYLLSVEVHHEAQQGTAGSRRS